MHPGLFNPRGYRKKNYFRPFRPRNGAKGVRRSRTILADIVRGRGVQPAIFYRWTACIPRFFAIFGVFAQGFAGFVAGSGCRSAWHFLVVCQATSLIAFLARSSLIISLRPATYIRIGVRCLIAPINQAPAIVVRRVFVKDPSVQRHLTPSFKAFSIMLDLSKFGFAGGDRAR